MSNRPTVVPGLQLAKTWYRRQRLALSLWILNLGLKMMPRSVDRDELCSLLDRWSNSHDDVETHLFAFRPKRRLPPEPQVGVFLWWMAVLACVGGIVWTTCHDYYRVL